MGPEAEEEIIPAVEPEEPIEGEDALQRFLRETKSGSGTGAPEKARSSGASGTTDEARDIGL